MTQETIIGTIKQCKDNYLVSAHSATIVESCKDALIAAGYKIYVCTLSWGKDPFPYLMDLFEGVKTDKDIDDTFEKLYWLQKPALSKNELAKDDFAMKYYELTQKAFRLACHGALERYGELTCWNIKDEMTMLGQCAHDIEWKDMPKKTSGICKYTPMINALEKLSKDMNDFVTTSVKNMSNTVETTPIHKDKVKYTIDSSDRNEICLLKPGDCIFCRNNEDSGVQSQTIYLMTESRAKEFIDKPLAAMRRVDEFKANASEELFQEFMDFVAEANTKSSQIIGIELPILMDILTEMFNHTLKPGCTLVSVFDAAEKLRQDKAAVFIETEGYPIADCVKVIKTE